MIDAKCDNGNVDVKASGTVIDISADLLTILHAVYVDMFNKDVRLALAMRDMVESKIGDCFVVQKEEMEDDNSN